jgi:hypothetical protein
MKDNLLELNGLTKFWMGRQVQAEYRVEKKNEIVLRVEVEEYIVSTGFALYEWIVEYSIKDVVEYRTLGSSAHASDIYESVLFFFYFIKLQECVPIDTWELVRKDINEFLANGNLVVLN